MTKIEWVLCPICSNKTRIKIRPDTVLENFPLFCPKCKKESLIDVKNFEVKVIEPDAQYCPTVAIRNTSNPSPTAAKTITSATCPLFPLKPDPSISAASATIR